MPEGEVAQNLMLFRGKTAVAAARNEVCPESLLVERVRSGDEEAFRQLYGLYAPTVHGVILARVPKDEVQDIVQEAFLSAYKNLHSLRDNNLFGPWLIKIARNFAINYYRRTKWTGELTDDLEARTSRKTEAAEILAEIRSLAECYREPLILRLVEGMTGKEIAERTGLKPESVRVNLHRGMEMLRKRLGIEERK